MISIPTQPSYDPREDMRRMSLSSFGAEHDFEPLEWVDGRNGSMVYPGNQGNIPMCTAEANDMFIRANRWKDGIKLADDAAPPLPAYERSKELDGNDDPGTSLSTAWQAATDLGYVPEHWTLKLWRTVEDYKKALHLSRSQSCLLGLEITEGWKYIDNQTGAIRTGGAYDRVMGGHAVLGKYYDTKDGICGAQTAWGPIGWRGLGFVQFTESWMREHLMVGASVYDTKRKLYL